MKSTPSAPPAPDYAAAATAQGNANVDAARLQARANNPNVNSPYGNQTVTWGGTGPASYSWNGQNFGSTDALRTGLSQYATSIGASPSQVDSWIQDPAKYGISQTSGTPSDQPTITQTLTPQAQQTLDEQQKVQTGLAQLGNKSLGTVQNVMGTPFSFGGPAPQTSVNTSGVAPMPVSPGMTGQNAIMSRLEPSLARQQTSLDTQLTNQGLRPGSEAWTNASTDFQNQANDQRTQAAMYGLNLDMNANNQGYNQALQSGQFANTGQQQALTQAMQQYNMPLNQITALMSGSQIQSPQFQGYQGSNIAPAPVFQAAQAQAGANQGLYNQQVGQQNAMTSGLFGLGGAALGAPTGTFPALFAALGGSDRRIKEDIEPVGRFPNGLNAYEFAYKPEYRARWGSGRHIGVMADEALEIAPGAVLTHPDGYLVVDYRRI